MGRIKYLVLLAMLTLSTVVMADEGILLHLKNGTTASFLFSEKPVLVTGESLVMKTTKEEVAYAYKDISKIQFGEVTKDPTAIRDLQTGSNGSVSFRLTDTGIEAVGLSLGEKVEVFDIAGKKVASSTSSANNASIVLPLPHAGKNVFVVRTSNGVTFKFLRK